MKFKVGDVIYSRYYRMVGQVTSVDSLNTTPVLYCTKFLDGTVRYSIETELELYLPEFLPTYGALYGTDNKECIHEWKTYVGFRESYKYCIKCDKKDL